jgi:hypothetical protein
MVVPPRQANRSGTIGPKNLDVPLLKTVDDLVIRMAISIPRAAGDDRAARTDGVEQKFRGRGAAPVVPYFQNVTSQVAPFLHEESLGVALHVPGEKRAGSMVFDAEDHRAIVQGRAFEAQARREDSERHRPRLDSRHPFRNSDEDLVFDGCGEKARRTRLAPLTSRKPELTDRKGANDRLQSRAVIRMRMSQRDHIESLYAAIDELR